MVKIHPRMWKSAIAGQFRKSVVLAAFFNLLTLAVSFILYMLFGFGLLDIFFTLILVESASLMISAGFIDFWNSASVRKFMKRTDGKDWSEEELTRAQTRALYPLFTGFILILELLISMIV